MNSAGKIKRQLDKKKSGSEPRIMLRPLELLITKLFYIQTKHNFDIKIIAKFVRHQNLNEGEKMLISNLFTVVFCKYFNLN